VVTPFLRENALSYVKGNKIKISSKLRSSKRGKNQTFSQKNQKNGQTLFFWVPFSQNFT
jgi:hypothetical protein